MVMLVKFSCGCIGFIGLGDSALVLSACDTDRDDPDISLFWRDLADKSHTPLPADEARLLLDEVAHLVGDGHRFREVRRLLG